MTNVRRPIHLQLQKPSAMVSSASGPGPFGESGGRGGSSGTPMSMPGQGGGGQPRTPIRPNALINFNCTQPPTITSPSNGHARSMLRGQTYCLAGGGGGGGGGLHSSNQHLYQPKALSPSGLNDSLPSQIIPHLYVGNQEQTNRETVNKLNIKYILSLGLLPIISTQAANNAANCLLINSPTRTTPTSPTITNNSNNKRQQSHGSAATVVTTKQEQQATSCQQPILMPMKNSSIDFKIKVRSNTSTTTPTTPTATTITPATATTTTSTSTTTTTNITATTLQISSDSVNCQLTTEDQVATTKKLHDENDGVKQVRSVYCKCINISDNSEQMLSKFFDEAYTFIDEARRRKCNILIHCLAGISRSPTIAIAYLMRLKSLHWKVAYDLVKQCRPQIDPNLNFMGQLRIYNRNLRDEQQMIGCKRNSNTTGCVGEECPATIKSSKTSCGQHNNNNSTKQSLISPTATTTTP